MDYLGSGNDPRSNSLFFSQELYYGFNKRQDPSDRYSCLLQDISEEQQYMGQASIKKAGLPLILPRRSTIKGRFLFLKATILLLRIFQIQLPSPAELFLLRVAASRTIRSPPPMRLLSQ
jgi:hypothetical protein